MKAALTAKGIVRDWYPPSLRHVGGDLGRNDAARLVPFANLLYHQFEPNRLLYPEHLDSFLYRFTLRISLDSPDVLGSLPDDIDAPAGHNLRSIGLWRACISTRAPGRTNDERQRERHEHHRSG